MQFIPASAGRAARPAWCLRVPRRVGEGPALTDDSGQDAPALPGDPKGGLQGRGRRVGREAGPSGPALRPPASRGPGWGRGGPQGVCVSRWLSPGTVHTTAFE